MKNLIKYIAIAVSLLVFSLACVGCSGENDIKKNGDGSVDLIQFYNKGKNGFCYSCWETEEKKITTGTKYTSPQTFIDGTEWDYLGRFGGVPTQSVYSGKTVNKVSFDIVAENTKELKFEFGNAKQYHQTEAKTLKAGATSSLSFNLNYLINESAFAVFVCFVGDATRVKISNLKIYVV